MSSSQAETDLSLAHLALTRGRGAEAAGRLRRLTRLQGLPPDIRTAVRIGLVRAWLLQGQIQEGRRALGPTPDKAGETAEPSQLSALWCLHAQVAFRSGERSRAIALLGKALKYAETAHDSHAIGLVHSELAQCYRHVGELAIVREHVSQATAALAAAGDHRHLALALTVTAVTAAQSGRLDEARATLAQAEAEATLDEADDVLALVCNNQANIAFIQHQHDRARSLYERSVTLAERCFPTYVLSIALASLGQCYVQIGELDRAETALKRALEARTQIQFHEITGAVYDSLAQLHLVRGEYDSVQSCLEQAFAAYGDFGNRAARWYAWSPRALAVRLALRRGRTDEALRLSDEIAKATGVPSIDRLDAELSACEALLLCDRVQDAESRLSRFKEQLDASPSVPAYGAYLRLRGQLRARLGRTVEAYHDLDQSLSLFDLIHHPYEAGLSERALGEVLLAAGEHHEASRHLQAGGAIFTRLGAQALGREVEQAAPSGETASQIHMIRRDAAALVRRVVDAAVLPQFLVRETAHALAEISGGSAVVFAQASGGDVRVLGHAGCDDMTALTVARASMDSVPPPEIRLVESLGRDHLGVRRMAIASHEELTPGAALQLRMIASVARLALDAEEGRDRAGAPQAGAPPAALEPMLPGFVCASAAMLRVVEQIRRLQGSDLTVLITGESGTGKDLVARAIHAGSPRAAAPFLPFNCTTTTREMADSQLFGHRRGSFTGAVADQPGVIKSAAGGTLFLDEVADLPLEVQPKLLRFLEQGEILPVGATRPQRVDVRIVAATNADLEQRVAERAFRDDLYYRLNVIHIHVPPLRERGEEIPHLSALFLREACDRLRKPGVQLGSDALALFAEYWWPGNVRQLRNEIHRAVAMSEAGGRIGVEDLAPEILASRRAPVAAVPIERPKPVGRLAPAVDELEREMIQRALEQSRGNISETARTLGLTRRGLYLKLRRLGVEPRPSASV